MAEFWRCFIKKLRDWKIKITLLSEMNSSIQQPVSEKLFEKYDIVCKVANEME